jgi:hypothetical protein
MQIYNVAPVFTARDVVMEPSYDGARAQTNAWFSHELVIMSSS